MSKFDELNLIFDNIKNENEFDTIINSFNSHTQKDMYLFIYN